jgi:hypothetical protein
MSDIRKMAQDAGFNAEFDDYVIDHWKRFEKFAELIAADTLAQTEQLVVGGDDLPTLTKWTPQRKPLTDEERERMLEDYATHGDIVRAVEKAHGIGEK